MKDGPAPQNNVDHGNGLSNPGRNLRAQIVNRGTSGVLSKAGQVAVGLRDWNAKILGQMPPGYGTNIGQAQKELFGVLHTLP